MQLSVISEATITGRFRIVSGVMECEARIVRRNLDGAAVETWSAWRPATEADHELSFLRRA